MSNHGLDDDWDSTAADTPDLDHGDSASSGEDEYVNPSLVFRLKKEYNQAQKIAAETFTQATKPAPQPAENALSSNRLKRLGAPKLHVNCNQDYHESTEPQDLVSSTTPSQCRLLQAR